MNWVKILPHLKQAGWKIPILWYPTSRLSSSFNFCCLHFSFPFLSSPGLVVSRETNRKAEVRLQGGCGLLWLCHSCLWYSSDISGDNCPSCLPCTLRAISAAWSHSTSNTRRAQIMSSTQKCSKSSSLPTSPIWVFRTENSHRKEEVGGTTPLFVVSPGQANRNPKFLFYQYFGTWG